MNWIPYHVRTFYSNIELDICIYRYLDAAVNFNSVEFCGINLLAQLTQIRLG